MNTIDPQRENSRALGSTRITSCKRDHSLTFTPQVFVRDFLARMPVATSSLDEYPSTLSASTSRPGRRFPPPRTHLQMNVCNNPEMSQQVRLGNLAMQAASPAASLVPLRVPRVGLLRGQSIRDVNSRGPRPCDCTTTGLSDATAASPSVTQRHHHRHRCPTS